MGETVKMKAPDGVSSVSCNGEQFDASKDGTFDIPAAYVDHLAQHGLTMVPGKIETKPAK